jgi:hypothetical protein
VDGHWLLRINPSAKFDLTPKVGLPGSVGFTIKAEPGARVFLSFRRGGACAGIAARPVIRLSFLLSGLLIGVGVAALLQPTAWTQGARGVTVGPGVAANSKMYILGKNA